VTDPLWDEAEHAVAVCVIAHGANNDMHHPFLQGIAEALVAQGISSLRFNFPYKDAGRGYPDRPPVLIEAWRVGMAEAERRGGGLPVIASGKSLGGRMASMLAAEDGPAFAGRGLVFFGYPLHAPGRPEKVRDAHLSSVAVPMLFIEGTADSLARFDLVQAVVERLEPLARLHVVEGGDHSFRVRGRKRPDDEIGRELGGVAASFIREVAS
jgi:predicted alpha/beta-hydrolase family hydrolase